MYKVALISGSLRKASTNTGLLRAFVAVQHPSFQFCWPSIENLPMFNEDLEQKEIPQSVRILRNQIERVDGVIFGVVEYNHTLSPSLKNAYDWISRRYERKNPPIRKKPVAQVSVGESMGGLRAQKHFKEMVQYLDVKLMNTNELAIKKRSGLFDEDGSVKDPQIKEKVKQFLGDFDNWIKENKK